MLPWPLSAFLPNPVDLYQLPQPVPVSPSGAAITPTPNVAVARPFEFREAQPGLPLAPQLRLGAQRWPVPQKTTKRGMRAFRTLDELMASCPTEAEMAQIRADFDVYFSPGFDMRMPCTPGGAESGALLSIYNALRIAYAMNFDAPLPLIGATNLYQWLKSLRLKWYQEAAPPGSFSHAACSSDDPDVRAAGACFVDSVVFSWTDPTAAHDPTNRLHPLRGPSVRGVPSALTGMNKLPGDAGGLSTWLHEARHTNAGGYKSHTCADHSGIPWSADASLAAGGCYALQYWYFMWMADHLPVGFLSPAQRHHARMVARSLRGPGGKFCDETAAPPVPFPSGRELLVFWGTLRSAASEPAAATLWLARDANARHLQASSLVIQDLPRVAISELALSLADYVEAYGYDRALADVQAAMDAEAAHVTSRPVISSSVVRPLAPPRRSV